MNFEIFKEVTFIIDDDGMTFDIFDSFEWRNEILPSRSGRRFWSSMR